MLWNNCAAKLPEIGRLVFLRYPKNDEYPPVLVYRGNDFGGWLWLDFWTDEDYDPVDVLAEWAYAKDVIDQA